MAIDQYARSKANKLEAQIDSILNNVPKGFNPETGKHDLPRLTEGERQQLAHLQRDFELYSYEAQQYEGSDLHKADRAFAERQAERRRIAEVGRRNREIDAKKREELAAIDAEIAGYYFPLGNSMSPADKRALTTEHRAKLTKRDQLRQGLENADVLASVAANMGTTAERVRAELEKAVNQQVIETRAVDQSGQAWNIRTFTDTGDTSITPSVGE